MNQKIPSGTKLRGATTVTGSTQEIEVKWAKENEFGGISYLCDIKFYLGGKLVSKSSSWYAESNLLREISRGSLVAYKRGG